MTIWKCKRDSGDCLKEVDTVNGDYLCGECEGCTKCCRCEEPLDTCEKHNLRYDDDKCPDCVSELEKEDEWEKEMTELREKQLA